MVIRKGTRSNVNSSLVHLLENRNSDASSSWKMLVCPNTFHIGEYKTRVADCKPFCLGSGVNIYWQNPEAIEMNCLMVCCVKCLPGWPLEEPWPLKREATLEIRTQFHTDLQSALG